MIDRGQFQQEVIETPLLEFNKAMRGYYSDDAVALLMGTAAIESHLGRYLRQLGTGPAKGPFQVEPETAIDNFDNYIRYRGELCDAIRWYMSKRLTVTIFNSQGKMYDKLPLTRELEQELTTNFAFNMLMARIKYKRSPLPLPDRNNIKAMSEYWELIYQGDPSKTIGETAEEFVDSYRRCVLGL